MGAPRQRRASQSGAGPSACLSPVFDVRHRSRRKPKRNAVRVSVEGGRRFPREGRLARSPREGNVVGAGREGVPVSRQALGPPTLWRGGGVLLGGVFALASWKGSREEADPWRTCGAGRRVSLFSLSISLINELWLKEEK